MIKRAFFPRTERIQLPKIDSEPTPKTTGRKHSQKAQQRTRHSNPSNATSRSMNSTIIDQESKSHKDLTKLFICTGRAKHDQNYLDQINNGIAAALSPSQQSSLPHLATPTSLMKLPQLTCGVFLQPKLQNSATEMPKSQKPLRNTSNSFNATSHSMNSTIIDQESISQGFHKSVSLRRTS